MIPGHLRVEWEIDALEGAEVRPERNGWGRRSRAPRYHRRSAARESR
jgi:hypothetical protein